MDKKTRDLSRRQVLAAMAILALSAVAKDQYSMKQTPPPTSFILRVDLQG